ncbi:MAG: zf-HC2 domain-containing protein [Anaerolineae bacterium]|jgi:anti-sigma factor RsiW
MSRFGKPDGTTKHEYYEERLSAYLDGELAPGEHEAVERHLATCQACQWDLDTLQTTVQWMGELPTVPLPRVFTIPAPAQPERTPWRRWGFLPVLQAATALVALLLFFAVAGDFLLSGPGTGGVSEPMLIQEYAPVAVEATQVVEVIEEAEAPPAPAADAAVSTVVEEVVVETVVETVAVEKEVAVEQEVVVATASAMPQAPAAAEPAAEKAHATPPQSTVMESSAPVAEEGLVGEAAEEPQAEAAPVEEAAAPEEQRTTDAVAGGVPSPTDVASRQPLPSRALAAPTVVAEAPAMAPAMPDEEQDAAAQIWREPGLNWLRVVQLTLAVLFVLLMAATIFATIQKRRAG